MDGDAWVWIVRRGLRRGEWMFGRGCVGWSAAEGWGVGSGCVGVAVWDQSAAERWGLGSGCVGVVWIGVHEMEYSKALGPTQACGNVGCAHFDCNGRLGCDPWEPVGVWMECSER